MGKRKNRVYRKIAKDRTERAKKRTQERRAKRRLLEMSEYTG